MINVCRHCGKEFELNAPQQKYCSDKCRIDANASQYRLDVLPIYCKICGEKVIPTSRKQRTCGKDECKLKLYEMLGHNSRCKFDHIDITKIDKIQRKCSKSNWNRLTPATRYKRMSLAELNEACLKLGLDYGQVQIMYYSGTLPQDFGKR